MSDSDRVKAWLDKYIRSYPCGMGDTPVGIYPAPPEGMGGKVRGEDWRSAPPRGFTRLERPDYAAAILAKQAARSSGLSPVLLDRHAFVRNPADVVAVTRALRKGIAEGAWHPGARPHIEKYGRKFQHLRAHNPSLWGSFTFGMDHPKQDTLLRPYYTWLHALFAAAARAYTEGWLFCEPPWRGDEEDHKSQSQGWSPFFTGAELATGYHHSLAADGFERGAPALIQRLTAIGGPMGATAGVNFRVMELGDGVACINTGSISRPGASVYVSGLNRIRQIVVPPRSLSLMLRPLRVLVDWASKVALPAWLATPRGLDEARDITESHLGYRSTARPNLGYLRGGGTFRSGSASLMAGRLTSVWESFGKGAEPPRTVASEVVVHGGILAADFDTFDMRVTGDLLRGLRQSRADAFADILSDAQAHADAGDLLTRLPVAIPDGTGAFHACERDGGLDTGVDDTNRVGREVCGAKVLRTLHSIGKDPLGVLLGSGVGYLDEGDDGAFVFATGADAVAFINAAKADDGTGFVIIQETNAVLLQKMIYVREGPVPTTDIKVCSMAYPWGHLVAETNPARAVGHIFNDDFGKPPAPFHALTFAGLDVFDEMTLATATQAADLLATTLAAVPGVARDAAHRHVFNDPRAKFTQLLSSGNTELIRKVLLACADPGYRKDKLNPEFGFLLAKGKGVLKPTTVANLLRRLGVDSAEGLLAIGFDPADAERLAGWVDRRPGYDYVHLARTGAGFASGAGSSRPSMGLDRATMVVRCQSLFAGRAAATALMKADLAELSGEISLPSGDAEPMNFEEFVRPSTQGELPDFPPTTDGD